MNPADRRAEFKVFVVDQNAIEAKSTSDLLQSMGYHDTSFYPTIESALMMVRQEMPHIIIFSYDSFDSQADKFLDDIYTLSSEILVILAMRVENTMRGLQFVSRLLAYDLISRPLNVSLELLQKVDRAAGRLYFQFESEQIRDHYQALGVDSALSLPNPPKLSNPDPSSEVVRPGYADLNEALTKLNEEKDVEESILIFMESVTRALYDVPVLYFKYFPAHLTFLFSRATLLPNEKFRGIGIDLRKENPERVPRIIARLDENPARVVELANLIKEVFKRETFSAFTHKDEGELRGLFVILDDADMNSASSKILTLRKIFDVCYRRNLAIKEKHVLETLDAMSGLYNRKYFTKVLAEEIGRARRILMPLTLIYVDLDHTNELNDKIGFQQTDTVIRSVGQLLKKTARLNDIVARVGPDEFACLLPHTSHMGGVVKAERLRRLVESTKIPAFEQVGPITISCGITEYPSFCGDGESLLTSADQALAEVKRLGGNKVCLSSAPAGFIKDFEPGIVPTPNLKSGGS